MELKLGPIPIRVQGWFLIMTLMLGANERDPVKIALWVAVVVVSVIVHELGHALMGMAFGLVPRIDLHGMGGTTSFTASRGRPGRGQLGPAKSIAVSIAGPLAGFLLGGALVVAERMGVAPTHPLASHAVSLLLFVNVAWGVFNLLPMLPLDGGNVLRSALVWASNKRGEQLARVISVVVAAGIVLYAVQGRQWWVLYLGAMFAFQNIQALRQASPSPADGA